MRTILRIHISLPRKPRQATSFRIFSTFNVTALVREVSEHHPALRPRHKLGKVKVAPDAAAGVPPGRRIDRHGMPNR